MSDLNPMSLHGRKRLSAVHLSTRGSSGLEAWLLDLYHVDWEQKTWYPRYTMGN